MAPSSYILVGRKWAIMQDVFYQNINLWITFRNFNVEEPNMSRIEEQLTRMDIKLPTPLALRSTNSQNARGRLLRHWLTGFGCGTAWAAMACLQKRLLSRSSTLSGWCWIDKLINSTENSIPRYIHEFVTKTDLFGLKRITCKIHDLLWRFYSCRAQLRTDGNIQATDISYWLGW